MKEHLEILYFCSSRHQLANGCLPDDVSVVLLLIYLVETAFIHSQISKVALGYTDTFDTGPAKAG